MTRQAKKVSVAMATFNGAEFLANQIQSILEQTLPASEIVVCDDRSNDDTVKILSNYQVSDAFRYSVNESRLGVIENFKKAVSLTHPDNYVAFSDQDDIWFPDKLESLVKRLSEIDDGHTPAMVYSDLTVIDRAEKIINPSFWNELGQDSYRHCFKTLLFGNFVTGCTILMNSQMKKYFLTMPSSALMHDHWLALIAHSFGKVGLISSPLMKYRKHGNNTAYSASHKKQSKLKHRLQNLLFMVFGKRNYLEGEIFMAELFYKTFYGKLTWQQKEELLHLISLKGRPFFLKKVAFHLAFKNHWL